MSYAMQHISLTGKPLYTNVVRVMEGQEQATGFYKKAFTC
jgi:hypothetical protein